MSWSSDVNLAGGGETHQLTHGAEFIEFQSDRWPSDGSE